ncbi:MAG: hypothetical protein AB7R55_03995 [Gemmatimonadales bacterium]
MLADPKKHWRPGKSAYELARAWEDAQGSDRGLPASVAAACDASPATASAYLVLGLPELQVEMPGKGRLSQTDLWALLRTDSGLVSMAVEGKAGEPFGPLVSSWLEGLPSDSNRHGRLARLAETIGVDPDKCGDLRYQLFHRTVSAIRMAERCRATAAALLVHAFGGEGDEDSRADFEAFCRLLGATTTPGVLSPTSTRSQVPLLVGWVDG